MGPNNNDTLFRMEINLCYHSDKINNSENFLLSLDNFLEKDKYNEIEIIYLHTYNNRERRESKNFNKSSGEKFKKFDEELKEMIKKIFSNKKGENHIFIITCKL